MITDHRFVGLRQWGMSPADDKPCQYYGHPSGVCGHRKDEHYFELERRRWRIPIAGDKTAGICAEREGDEYVLYFEGTRAELTRMARNMLEVATQ